MSLEPSYEQQADAALRAIETDPDRRPLRDAIYDVIDLVCDQPESAQARRHLFPMPSGAVVRVQRVRCQAENDDYVLVWHPDHVNGEAVILYIGTDKFL